jgi:hypothetical protein
MYAASEAEDCRFTELDGADTVLNQRSNYVLSRYPGLTGQSVSDLLAGIAAFSLSPLVVYGPGVGKGRDTFRHFPIWYDQGVR